MRHLTGVPENLLDDVPSERPRYTGLAWTMLGTASLAVVGMVVLIVQISDLPWPIVVAAGFGWGLLILGIDYLVVSFLDDRRALATAQTVVDRDTKVPGWWRSGGVSRTLIRILLASILGLVVGESVVIAAFSSAEEKHLDTTTQQAWEKDLCVVDIKLSRFRREVQPAATCPTSPTVAASSNGGTTTQGNPVVNTDAATARLAVVDKRIRFFSDLAQCEQYPQAFSKERRQELGCSGKTGNGPARKAALRQVANFTDEKTSLQKQLKEAQDVTIAASKAQAAEDAKQRDADQRVASAARNSPEALALAGSKARLEQRLADLRDGVRREPYGLNERFVASEQAVNPWIRWSLRLLFVLVDMTPVLLKLAMGTSTVDQMVAIRRRMAIYPYLQELKEVEDAYASDRSVREVIPVETAEPTAHRRGRVPDRIGLVARNLRQNWAGRSPAVDSEAATSTGQGSGVDEVGTGAAVQPEEDSGRVDSSAADVANLLPIDNKLYRLRRRVGAGRFASIWFAKPSNPNAFEHGYPLVIKLPHDDPASRDQLTREYELYTRLSTSRGVPQLVSGDRTGLVLRYYPRTSLDRWYFSAAAADRRFSFDELLGWLDDSIRTLEQIWEQGYAHGDGKPANVVLTGDTESMDAQDGQTPGRALLIDFGSSVELGQKLRSVSPGYAPPELLRRPKSALVTPLCDVYSFLGATLYYLCSGGMDPWLDQVRHLWPQPGSSQPKARDLLIFQKAWLSTSRDRPATPLSALNPQLPLALGAQIATWMSEEPERRLDLAGLAPEQWVVAARWQPATIAGRLRRQVQRLNESLERDLGREQMEAPLLGVPHPNALPPESYPDFTVNRDVLLRDLEGKGEVA